MMRPFLAILSACLCAVGAAGAAPLPRVAIVTSEGTMIAELDTKRAPITANNFLRYADAHKFDNTSFYRTARSTSVPGNGLIQGGIDHDLRKTFLPIKHEPTSQTGLRHINGTLSMARNEVGSAMGDFFITLGPAPHLDARGSYAGYAAFGRLVSGFPVAKKILAKPTFPGGYDAITMGQSIRQRPKIITIRRIK